MSTNQQLLEREAQHNSGLWHGDIAFVSGDGPYLYDADGRRYLDFMAGIAVASLGHAHPRLAEALAEQARRLVVCPQNLGNDVRTEFLERLFTFVAAPLRRAFLTNSGTEANEAAIKWAIAATGRRRFVAAKRGFAGRSLGSLSLTWEPKYREPFGASALEVEFVRYNSVEDLAAAVDERVAALILEPVQGEGGVHPAEPEFLEGARRLSREAGALLVLDEIQTGVGRTGTFLASEPYGVEPDMVTLAKGLAGGVPIGALLMTESVARAMPKGGHGSTFGGNPLAAAAGLAVLEEIERQGLLERAARLGERLKAGLEALDDERVREVRGRGLMLGIELKEKAAPLIEELRRAGLLTINAGATVIRMLPPLIIEERHADEAVTIFAEALRRSRVTERG